MQCEQALALFDHALPVGRRPGECSAGQRVHELHCDLKAEARRLADRIGRVPGIKTLERMAYPKREVDVQLAPGRLAQLKLAPSIVLQAIQGENANIPGDVRAKLWKELDANEKLLPSGIATGRSLTRV